MPSTEEVIDNFLGMITRKQAQMLTNQRESGGVKKEAYPIREVTSVKSLLEFAHMKGLPEKNLLSDAKHDIYTVNLEDRIYRIFNLVKHASQERNLPTRTMVLGSENSTVRLNLSGKISEFIDINGFEAGDLVLVKNILFEPIKSELRSTSKTVISRLSPSRLGITDYSKLLQGMKNISLIGKVIEIDPIRHVSRLNSGEQVAVAGCKITDLNETVSVSFWESSAIATTKFNLNDFIKLEFCSIHAKNNFLEVYCNNFSRVLINNGLSARLKKRG